MCGGDGVGGSDGGCSSGDGLHLVAVAAEEVVVVYLRMQAVLSIGSTLNPSKQEQFRPPG